MIVSTQCIVLMKRQYRETALLLEGISPDSGRLSLVIHGAQKLSSKDFPAADLYRELEVEYREEEKESASTLHTVSRAELLAEFDALADNPRHYAMAGRIGAFLLRNLQPSVPQPYTYDTLRSVFSQLAGEREEGVPAWSLEQCAVVIKTAFLYENGLLPEARSERQSDFLENLVAAGIDNSALPACRAEYWTTLNRWLDSLLEYHQLKK